MPWPWGAVQGQRVPGMGWLCSFLPPPVSFPKASHINTFFAGCRGDAAWHACASVSPGCT